MKTTVLIAALLMGSAAATFAADHRVAVSDFRFGPKTVSAVVGDTISWSWRTGMHTTTSVTVPSGAAPWNAPIDVNNQRFRVRLTVAGTYRYQCNFHFAQGMTGTIRVSASPGHGPVN